MRRDFESFRTTSNSLKCALFWVSVAKIRSDPLKKRHILVVRRSTSGFFRSFSWAFADFLAPLTIFHQKMSTFNARFARSYMSGKCRLLNIISDFALLLFPKSAQIWRLTWEALLGLVPFKSDIPNGQLRSLRGSLSIRLLSTMTQTSKYHVGGTSDDGVRGHLL